ncbi:unnamed protein product [Fraxinus pennsylvanica]|uniref:Uncharacterized protein n=1 Tax=Fraxinus pennsylvanica TaxID=56036 RepID=A0AAD1YP15_9LAMI|nr:unnamed protein product [Fraxinus pennsylvanica]
MDDLILSSSVNKTRMKKLLKIPFSATLRIHHFPFNSNLKFSLSNPSDLYPNSHSIILLKWVSSFSRLPPPEWVQPITDLSDLVTTDSKKDLQPSPWVQQILNLLHNNTNLEQDLTEFCRKYLIKLPSNFVAFILKKWDQVAKQPEIAYGSVSLNFPASLNSQLRAAALMRANLVVQFQPNVQASA